MSADEAVRAEQLEQLVDVAIKTGPLSDNEVCRIVMRGVIKRVLELSRTHTLAGAGEVEKWLRDDTVFNALNAVYDHQAFAERCIQAADLIAARERIAELEKALNPFATALKEWNENDADEQWLIVKVADDEGDFTIGDLRRARAALGREG